MTNLTGVRGDTNEYTLTITAPDASGVSQPIDLDTVDQLWFTVKDDWDDPDVDAVFQKTLGSGIVVSSPASDGIAVVTLDPEDTEDLVGLQRLVYDVQMLESNGVLTTVSKGFYSLERDATRATV